MFQLLPVCITVTVGWNDTDVVLHGRAHVGRTWLLLLCSTQVGLAMHKATTRQSQYAICHQYVARRSSKCPRSIAQGHWVLGMCSACYTGQHSTGNHSVTHGNWQELNADDFWAYWAQVRNFINFKGNVASECDAELCSLHSLIARVGSRVVRIDLLRFLARCKSPLNQALSVM